MATYGSEEGVEALLPTHGNIGASSVPTATQLTSWLAQGYSIINRKLGAAGYAVPITASLLTDELAALNNLFAAGQLVQALGLDTLQGLQEERSTTFLTQFWAWLNDLVGSDLIALGVLSITPPATDSLRWRRIRTTQMRKTDGYSGASETVYDQYEYPES